MRKRCEHSAMNNGKKKDSLSLTPIEFEPETIELDLEAIEFHPEPIDFDPIT